jgi:hypothetical protein
MQEPGSPGPASKPPGRRASWLPLLLVGTLALVQAGCLVVAAGVVGGAAATGYVWYKGRWCRDYLAGFNDTAAALRTALVELQFPITSEETKNGTTYFGSRTADGTPIRILVEPVPSRIPAEGTLTRVAIRVGFAGDEALSSRIFDQVARHLVPPMLLPPTPPTGPPLTAVSPSLRPVAARVPVETAAPPLAPPLPPPVKGQ